MKTLIRIILEAIPEIWWAFGAHVVMILTTIGGIYGLVLLIKAIVGRF